MSANTMQRISQEVGRELAERRDSRKAKFLLAKRPGAVPLLTVVESDGGRLRTRAPGHGLGVTVVQV